MIVYLEHHPYHRSCWITFVGVKPPQRESHLLFAIVVSAFFSTAGVPVHLWHTFFKTKLPFLHLDQWLLLITAAAPSMSSRIGTLEQSWSQTVNAEKFQGLPESSNDVSEFGKAEQSLEVIKFYKCWAYYQLSISSTFFLPRFSPSRPLNIEMNPVLSSNDLLEQLEEFRSQVIVAQYCLIALGIVGAFAFYLCVLQSRLNRYCQAWLWDAINNIYEDVALFSRPQLSLTDAIYIFSRLVSSQWC